MCGSCPGMGGERMVMEDWERERERERELIATSWYRGYQQSSGEESTDSLGMRLD